MVGATPYFLAAVSADAELLQMLSKYEADATITTKNGNTPLMVAARSSCTGMNQEDNTSLQKGRGPWKLSRPFWPRELMLTRSMKMVKLHYTKPRLPGPPMLFSISSITVPRWMPEIPMVRLRGVCLWVLPLFQ